MSGIAKQAIARPRWAVVIFVALFAFAGIYGGSAPKVLKARNDFQDPGSQSARTQRQIERAGGTEPSPGVLVLADAPTGARSVARVRALLAEDPSVARVAAPIASSGGRRTLLAVTLRSSAEPSDAVEALEKDLGGLAGVKLGGSDVANRQVGQQASQDLGLAELLAFPLLALLAFFIFRGIAALLPITVGGLSVLLAFAALRAIDTVLPLSTFALNLVIGLGLGLAVDYSLFMVSRLREELGSGHEPREAALLTVRSAGRTIMFSAATVATALLSLVVFPLRFLQSMGIGGAAVTLIAAAVSVTLLPALFVLLAPHLGRTVPGPSEQGRWYRLAHRVLRRPGLVAAVTAGAMILIALPALRVQWTGVDGSVLPGSKSARVVEQALAREFPAVGPTPTIIALSAPAAAGGEVARYVASVRSVADVTAVSTPAYIGNSTWQLAVRTGGWELGPPAQRAIAAIRAIPSSLPANVGGRGAEFADQRTALGERLPLALAILVLGTLIALWLMTGSVTLPFKALLMNTLTVGAATGLLVLVFQDGRLQGLLGYTTEHGLEQSDFLVLAAIAFGLSTDYGVFLLSRIKEAHDQGHDDNESIALGLQRTGRIVTAAAVLLAVAIGAFASSHIIFLKEIGVGAVAAVLLDAFVVRTLLVPALMGLLGPWNWWAPRPLRRLHERFGLEEGTVIEPGLAAPGR